MAVTNDVTKATSVWQGTSRPARAARDARAIPVRGVGIAIVDSGIATHTALDSRVVAHVNLVSDEPGVTGDPFGHGTHVAGIVGGNRTAATLVTTAFSGGSAPSAKLIDVRVLGADGSGLTSDVIAGIDWAISHSSTYNIRVINLSLGHPVTEPSATDPLCQAVARAVAAGITVVVSAGNYGLTSSGQPVLGGITSPGNSPLALTVGALDTKDTIDPSDDEVAPYSSKGPARYEMGGQARRRRAGHAHRVARGAELLHQPDLSAVAHRRQRQERVSAPERHEHVDGGRQRRRGAADQRLPVADAGAGEAGDADGRALHARRGPGRLRHRQRRTSRRR